jgi:putative membrane protein insertion efficiency factor
LSEAARRAARALIRAYQLSFSALLGRQCRYLPTCSAYTDEAIARHGVWPGLWMGTARVCRCHPLGGSGYDPPPPTPPPGASWRRPWRYGAWRTPAIQGRNGAFMAH